MPNTGNPRCTACGGRGGWQGPDRWIKCACVVPSAEVKRAMKRAHEIASGQRQMTMDEMIQIGSTQRRADNG